MIKKAFDEKVYKLCDQFDAFPFEDRTAYCQWMNQQFYLIQHSTRYLALAGSMVDVNDSAEFKWWVRHLAEEVDHDKTIVKDIKSLGYDHFQPEIPQIRALVSAQYYDIMKNGQDALLGYSLLLEGVSCYRCADLAERIEKAHKSPATYMRLHASADAKHYVEGVERIETLTKDRQSKILKNLEMMSTLYYFFMDTMRSSSSEQRKAA